MYFFFNDTATTKIYPLSLHDALPICSISFRGRDFTRPISSVQGMQLTSIRCLLARICDYSAQAGSDNRNVKDARFRKESGGTRSILSGRSPSTRSVLDISSDSEGA